MPPIWRWSAEMDTVITFTPKLLIGGFLSVCAGISCIAAGEYTTASHSIGETFWSMAEDLKNLDSSEDNRKNYELLIRERNIDALALFATRCEYSGFSRSIESIEESKDYIAAPDAAWTENAIEETIALFN